ncbi:hypothetical protein PSTT_03939 [Puccinia striiformis]|uniref:Uncharacterized protein n=1 Tax=Puccinia striiformis TaxID=27350 RepID=A0A2S4VUH7_9BASI|nr:hypothetical protein PSTT_03939 [Puccinia striiformis]
MRNLSLIAFPLGLLVQLVWSRPPPTEYRSVTTQGVVSPTPQYASLLSPLSGQRYYRGQSIPISFTDPGASATEARFSISNYTGLYQIGKASLKNNGRITTKITLPNWVKDGTYDFVVSENDGPFGSDDFNTDVVICTVFVGQARANQVEFAPFRNQAEENQRTGSGPAALQKREPHPPKFVTPLPDQSVPAGSPIPIRFLDGQLQPGITQARFVLRPLVQPTGPQEYVLAGPNSSEEGIYTFDGVAIVANISSPVGTPPGTYSLMAEEVFPETTNRFQSAATIQIQIIADDSTEEEALNTDPVNEENQLATNQASLKIRSESSTLPPTPAFISPTLYQKVTTGHHLNISFFNVDRKSDKMSFILKPISTESKQKELILFSRNAASVQLFYNTTVCNALVFIPAAIANGFYNLVAQEVYSADKVKEVGSIEIKVVRIRPRKTVKSRAQPKKDATGLPGWGGVSKPLGKKTHPLLPVTVPVKISPNQSVSPKNLKNRQTRESPTMLEPSPNQEVPSGSSFVCKIQDQHATSETVQFVLRSFGGYEQYLGSAKFVKGVATFKATCPTNLHYDTYSIVALMNSVKKPKRFLDVISASVIVSHPASTMMTPQAPLVPGKHDTTTSQMVSPSPNQYIAGGKPFECRLLNGVDADRVKFCIRFDDGRSDLLVGNCEIRKNLALTMCQIPSSCSWHKRAPNLNRTHTQTSIKFLSMWLTRRGFGPDLEDQRAKEIVKRSSDALQSDQEVQVSVLREPMSYQNVVPGKGFDVKLTKNTAPLSTMLRFLLKPMATASGPKVYVLGTTSNAQAVEEALRCPDHIPNGNYREAPPSCLSFKPMIQMIQSHIDSSSTPIIVNSQAIINPTTNNSTTISSNNDTIASDPKPIAPDPIPVAAQSPQSPTTQPMRYSDPVSSSSSSSPNGLNSSTVPPPPPVPVDRASTPHGQGFSRNNSNNIFTSSAHHLVTSLYPVIRRLGTQALGILLSFALFF